MNADDFQELYKLLRGSRSAMTVLDARTSFNERKMSKAYDQLVAAREAFLESRTRLLKTDADKQIDPKAKDASQQLKKLKRKQEKTQETLQAFDELLPALEKYVAREKAAAASEEAATAAASSVPPPPATIASAADVSAEFIDEYQNASGDQRMQMINDRFDFQEVQSDDDIHGNAIYFVCTDQQSLLVQTPPDDQMQQQISLQSVVDSRPIKPFSRSAFLKLGAKRQMVLLLKKDTVAQPPGNQSSPEYDSDDDDASDESASDDESGDDAAGGEQSILDMGAFSQLLMSAQRCGLVPGADQIGHVRDREFRLGKYDLAFAAIDAMFNRFSSSMNERNQRLVREDADIASGRIQMSPKDVQAKRVRDRMQSQEIDRTRRRFQVVLEGLRMLLSES